MRIGARQRGYDSKWDKARKEFLQVNKWCCRCSLHGNWTLATTVDHIVPHLLAEAKTPAEIAKARKLFWDKNNWQPLCKPHHDSTKQREERGDGGMRGCTVDGRPLDPNHPWNTRR